MDDLIQDLPPELFNEIKNFVFTTTTRRVIIDEKYTPPTSLHVDKNTRSRFAELFYGSGTIYQFRQPYVLYRWLRSLSHDHLDMVEAMELHVKPPLYITFQDAQEDFPRTKDCQYFIMDAEVRSLGIKIPDKIIRLVLVDSEDTESFRGWVSGLSACRSRARMSRLESRSRK